MFRTKVEAAFALLALGACRATESTIPERIADPEAPAQTIALSALEERPELSLPATQRTERAESELPENEPEPAKLGGDARFTFDWRGANLSQAMFHLAETAGVSIYLEPDADRRIDVSLRNATLDEAAEVLLGRNGLCLRESPKGVFWVEACGGSRLERRTFYVQSIDAADAELKLKELLDTTARIVVEPAQNLIVVRGTHDDCELAARYLADADRLERQVLIEVKVLEVTLGDKFQVGMFGDVLFHVSDGTLNFLQELGAADESFSLTFDDGDGDVNAALELLSRYAGVNTVSTPRVLAVTNTEASIEVVREVPYVNVTSTTTGTTAGVGSSVVEEVQFKEAGIKMTVRPTIQEGGVVHIKLDQTFSEVVEYFNDIPVIDKRHLASEFQVQDRGTIVLGGLMQDRRAEIDSGVPGLMDLPLVGRLFRGDEDQVDKRELLVFLTPRIVDPREASGLADAYRNSWVERVRESGMGPAK
ncbi:MAG: type II and III secretion system protein [Planctomycetes bacterium]|nr:type II and III secretion system protein [Planctomycetota bacterium]